MKLGETLDTYRNISNVMGGLWEQNTILYINLRVIREVSWR